MEQVAEQGATLWVVSPDEPERLRGLWEEEGLSFPGLVDADGEVIRRYGLLNEDNPPLPHPTTLVIDEEGLIRWMQVNEDYKVRPATSSVVEALGSLSEADR